MPRQDRTPETGRLIAVSGGFLGPSKQARRIRRILELAGHRPCVGWPGSDDAVVAWGHAPRARRAEALAARTGAAVWRVEDAWIRSIRPGRVAGEPPMGLLLDRSAMHYDPSRPSDLESMLANDPLDDGHLIARARLGIERLRALDLSKYNAHDPALKPPPPGYVLVIDQVRGDASLTQGGRDGPLDAPRLFRQMLFAALEENPGARILIRSHPETASGQRAGYFAPADAVDRIAFVEGAHSPWSLLDGAVAVYTVSSQMGFEAILAGHRPHVFGTPFYAGWGLTEDRDPLPRRQRKLTRAQLFGAAMIRYPLWYDPLRDQLCAFEEVVDQMEARLRHFRQDRAGHVAFSMRAWKRPAIQRFFGGERPVIFAKTLQAAVARAAESGRGVLGWASAVPEGFEGIRVEDGFLRSRGLGADLVPPSSLAVDDLGIHYDPGRESRLERLIAGALPPGGAARAQRLRERLLATGVTKYNLECGQGGEAVAALRGQRPNAPVILVPGQVENDASILLGAGAARTNRDLLLAARDAHPGAILVYKPHPDVEAGLRPGAVSDAADLADVVLDRIGAVEAIAIADRVWTITSGLGFEALLRGVPVTCLGSPFYAGWGLTDDRGPVPERRLSVLPRPDLDRLVHAALIAYPRYVDPVSGQPCPPELAVERLARGQQGHRSVLLRALARAQGMFAGYAHLWR